MLSLSAIWHRICGWYCKPSTLTYGNFRMEGRELLLGIIIAVAGTDDLAIQGERTPRVRRCTYIF
jgi:hypothetical protein